MKKAAFFNAFRAIKGSVAVGFISVSCVSAQSWTATSAPTTSWLSIGSSADGAVLFASSGYPDYSSYISYDSGADWVRSSLGPYGLRGVACSGDGRTLVAAGHTALGPTVFVSTNSGNSWSTNVVWFASFTPHIACSFDGSRMILSGGDVFQFIDASPIFTSTNSGAIWATNSDHRTDWVSVACSTDGSTLVALGNGFPVFTSSDLGVTWHSNSTPTSTTWSAVTCSADGSKIVAGDATTGWLYRTADRGMHWTSNNFPARYLYALACSADGTRVVGGCYSEGPLYTSTDAGATWTSNSIAPRNWISVASSADGSKLAAAAALGDSIFVQQTLPRPVLNTVAADGNIFISWTLPSLSFAVQETRDPTTDTWTNMSATPILNTMNLQYQVTLPFASGNHFYRLLSQ